MVIMFYYTYDRRNMFRALLCPSSGAHDYSADYARRAITCSPDTYPACLHLTSNKQQPKKPDCPCGNQHYSRELLMMGIIVPETC